MEYLKEKVKELRQKRDWTQEDLAALVANSGWAESELN